MCVCVCVCVFPLHFCISFFSPFLLHLGCVIVVEEKFTWYFFFLLLWLLGASLSLAFVSVSDVGFYFSFLVFWRR